MSQKNDTPALLISLILTGAIVAGGIWLTQSGISLNQDTSTSSPVDSAQTVRISAGETILLTATPEQQAAANAIANQNYSAALQPLESLLQKSPNHPEALIYLNNARIGASSSYAIAVAVPITGNPDVAAEILRGVAQAQNAVNQQGGIRGVPLKVFIADDQNLPEMGEKVGQKFIENPAILGVVGHFSSDVSQKASTLYQKAGLVMISPSSTAVSLSQAGDYIFRTTPSDAFTAKALARYQLDQLKRQQAVVFYNEKSAYSVSLKSQFTTELLTSGGNIVQEFDVSASDFNAAQSLEQAIAQQAEVIVLLTNTPTLDQALQVIQINDKRLPLLGGDSLYNPKILQFGASDVVGMVVAVPWHILAHPNAAFPKAATQLWQAEVNWRTAMAYDATQALIAGLQQNPTRQGVQVALSQGNFSTQGATDLIRFLPSGDRNQPVQLVQIEPGKRSGFGNDFNPIP